jgi:uncharacterized protein DUF6894
MPRYFFHTKNPKKDAEGREFADIATAKCEAVRYAGQFLRDVAEDFWKDANVEMTVTNERGLVLFTMQIVGRESPGLTSGGARILS